ncbi:MAG TPA: ribosome silencing factor [Chlamydiales bacterium]|nr:ribosome silencing factor [Chlamydiales bacterium]
MKSDPVSMLNSIAQLIYEKNGFNILAIDVQGFSTITDYFLIAEGHVDRHLMSIAQSIIANMEKLEEKLIHIEGLQTGDWIVLDYGPIMIHLFTAGLREKYSLERLWPDSKLVEIKIKHHVV